MSEPVFVSQGVDYLGFLRAKLGDLRGTAALANELIQNADDAKATHLVVELTPDRLVVSNNAAFSDCGDVLADRCLLDVAGDGKKCCDFHAFRRVASGHKQVEEGTTGAFGIGFISVYQITDRPKLMSGNWQWEMNPEAPEPERIAAFRLSSALANATRFEFPWAASRTPMRERLALEPMSAEAIQQMGQELRLAMERAAPFLKHLQQMELRLPSQAVLRIRRTLDTSNDHITVSVDGASRTWLKLQGDFDGAAIALRKQFHGIEPKRLATVTLAVPLLGPEAKLPEEGWLYASLPTEHRLTLPLLINADFYPNTDRKRILFSKDHRGAWNTAAIQAAAAVLSHNLTRLQETLSRGQFWHLMSKAKEMADESAQLKTDDSLSFAAFWERAKPALQTTESVWTASGLRVMPNRSRHAHKSEAFEICQPWLTEIGLHTVHAELRPHFNVLSEIGVSVLDLGAVTSAISAAGLTTSVSATNVPVWLQDSDNLKHLSELIADLLEKVPLPKRRDPLNALKSLALWPTSSGGLAPANGLLSGTQAERQLFADLPVVDIWLSDTAPLALSAYVTRFSAEKAVEVLKGLPSADLQSHLDAKPEWLWPFLEWLDGRHHELSSSFTKSDLKALPIWPTGEGHSPLEGLSVPGDFEDPLKLSRVLDSRHAQRFQNLVCDVLGVARLSLSTYLRSHLVRAFRSDGPPDEVTRRRLLNLLAYRLGQLRTDSTIKEVLQNLPLVPSMAGTFHPPQDLYLPSDGITDLVGHQASLHIESSLIRSDAIADLLRWLGVREQPSPNHVVQHIMALVSQKEQSAGRIAIQALFKALVSRWYLLAPQREQFASLTKMAWLPSTRSAGWFKPAEIYASFQQYLFESQAEFLDIPRGTQSSASQRPEGQESLLEFLGVQSVPPCVLVVQHLLAQASKGQSINKEVFKYLDQHHDDPSIARLFSHPCIPVEDGVYIEPKTALTSAHQFGRFRTRLSSDWLQFNQLMTRLGVGQEPDADDAASVLREVAEDYKDNRQLSDADRDVVIYAWTLISAEGEIRRTALARTMKSLRVVPNGNGFLKRPSEVFFEDRPGLANKFDQTTQAAFIKKPEGAWPAMEAAGVGCLSSVVNVSIVECESPEPCAVYGPLIRDRWRLIRQVHSALQQSKEAPPEVVSVNRLEVAYSLFSSQGITDQPVVFFDQESERLLIRREARGAIPAIAREMAYWLQPDATAGLLAAALSQVLQADDLQTAREQLSDLGIAEVDVIDLPSDSDPHEMGTGALRELDDDVEAPVASASSVEQADAPEAAPPASQSRNATEVELKDHGSSQHSPGSGATQAHRSPSENRTSAGGGEPKSRARQSQGSHTEATNRPKNESELILRSYVRGPRQDGDDAQQDDASNERQLEIDRLGTDVVLKHELMAGREPKKMDHFHPGYDIVSHGKDGAQRYIEVKSMAGAWKLFSVGMSPVQFQQAQKLGDEFWLYVVEGVETETPKLYAIQNPAQRIVEFRFDEGWRVAAEAAPELSKGVSTSTGQVAAGTATLRKSILTIARPMAAGASVEGDIAP